MVEAVAEGAKSIPLVYGGAWPHDPDDKNLKKHGFRPCQTNERELVEAELAKAPRSRVSERYPHNARLSRWDVVSGGLVICAVALTESRSVPPGAVQHARPGRPGREDDPATHVHLLAVD